MKARLEIISPPLKKNKYSTKEITKGSLQKLYNTKGKSERLILLWFCGAKYFVTQNKMIWGYSRRWQNKNQTLSSSFIYL